MNQPTPAIVTQDAVRRLPRLALLLLCLAYVLPGFLGRAPWKGADFANFGYMAELARGGSAWLQPSLLGQAPEVQGPLPLWLGAWALRWAPLWLAPDLAARVPFMLLLMLTLTATWYGVYHLARSTQAQPVSFAFGGEAQPKDYARAMADGGLLALLACLGLAQLSHETTPALAQLAFSALAFYGLAALQHHRMAGSVGLGLGLAGLGLSGAPALALLFGLGGALVEVLDRSEPESRLLRHRRAWQIVGIALLTSLPALVLDLWRWRVHLPEASWNELHGLTRLWLWFSWPAWPLTLWTLWRWRRQRWSRHVALPFWFAAVGFVASFTTAGMDRALLLTLPAMAALAAFALPTLSRGVAALIDWFTLLFFSVWALFIWLYWISMQTGVPPQPAANVARLFPGFVPQFSWLPFLLACAATLSWVWLVRWRTGRHRAAIWKSLVLPAGGMVLSWLLIMTLWLPIGDFARGYAPLVRKITALTASTGCVQAHGLTRAQIAAFRFHGAMDLQSASRSATCEWLLVDSESEPTLAQAVNLADWTLLQTLRRPSDNNEDLLLFRRLSPRP